MDIKETFSKKLIELRENEKLTKKELAEKLEISAASLGYYESGERLPDISTACKIADYFNITCDELIRGVKSENVDINKRLGLNDKAISMLSDRSILAYSSTKGENNFDLYVEVLNELLSNSTFYLLAYNCAKLKDISSTLYSNGYFTINDIAKFDLNGEEHKIIHQNLISNLRNIKYEENDKDCDICRYLIFKTIEEISDIFDYRKHLSNFTKEEFFDYFYNFCRECDSNAQHNPKEE